MKPSNLISLFVILISISACQQTSCTEQEAALQEMKKVVADLQAEKKVLVEEASDKHTGDLIHLVYFSLKPDLTENEIEMFKQELLKLKAISFLKDLEIGSFKNLGDSRAMDQFDLLMQMRFTSDENYQKYQAHPKHLELKKVAANYLAAPPVTYDYLIQ